MSETAGDIDMVVGSELDNSAAIDKAVETTQLDDRNVGVGVGKGIEPPYDPAHLASFSELNGTHARAVGVKARWEVGFGFDIVPHPAVESPDESQKARIEDFWHGQDSRWKIGPEGTAAATPDEVLALLRRDWHGQGWLSGEILTNNAGEAVGLAHVPATTTRVRKATDGANSTIAGTGYVQVKENATRYFGEAGDRHADDPTFVDGDSGEVYDSGSAVPGPVANELIFVPNPSPLALYYGIPDWVAEIQTMAAEQSIKEYNRDLFEHKAIPYLAVIVKNGTLTEESRSQLRGIIHGLKGENHRTVILEAEKIVNSPGNDLMNEDGSDPEIELQPLGLQQDEDMAFTQFREFNEHDVAQVHGVPNILLNKTQTSNRSNSQQQIQTFANEEIAPEQSRFAERLYRIIHVAYLDAPDWTIKFTLRGSENRERDAQIVATKLQHGAPVVTVNEAREWMDLDPLDGPMGEMMVAEAASAMGGSGTGGSIDGAIEDEIASQTDDVESNLREEFVTDHLIGRGGEASAD